MYQKIQTCHGFLYSLFYKNPKDLKIVGLIMAKIQGPEEWIDKCKIAILNFDFILNLYILGPRNMEVLNFASPKWVYMLKSVEKWLSKTRKYKTVVGGAILKYCFLMKF
jgi:hypothetical protein